LNAKPDVDTLAQQQETMLMGLVKGYALDWCQRRQPHHRVGRLGSHQRIIGRL